MVIAVTQVYIMPCRIPAKEKEIAHPRELALRSHENLFPSATLVPMVDDRIG